MAEFYLEEIQCDWGVRLSEIYYKKQITSELIAKIKRDIIDKKSELYTVYAIDNRDNWLLMQFRGDRISIEIIFENPEHHYVFFNSKYEKVKNQEFIEFDQDLVPLVATCDDFGLAANIFEEWALHGRLFPTSWVDDIEGTAFDNYFEEESESYYRLYITDFGKNKSKTIVFLKKYFKDSNFEQTQKRVEHFPLLLCVATESEIFPMEEKLKEIGIKYKKEKISEETYMRFYFSNPQDTLWDKLDGFLHL